MATNQNGQALHTQYFGRNESQLNEGWGALLILQKQRLILFFQSTLQKQITYYPLLIQFSPPPISLSGVRLPYKSAAISYQNSRVKSMQLGFKQQSSLNDNTKTLSTTTTSSLATKCWYGIPQSRRHSIAR